MRWYRQAAEKGSAKAQFNLGNLYYKGEGVARNYGEAAKWYRRAAAQGNAEAQYHLGVIYGNGLGVPRDDAEAKKWYSRAAKKGHVGAQGALAVLYGDSTPASPVRVEGGKTAESNSWGVFLLLIAVLYFAPTVVAFRREHNNAVPIFLVNLLFGWVYGIGWVIALLWAFSDNTKERRHKVVVNPDNPLNSLVVCQMCGRQISPRATACPGCGHPKEERDG